MSKHKALTGAIAALASVATLGALAAPALAADTTYSPNGKPVAELAKHGGAQRIATIGNKNAKNVILFLDRKSTRLNSSHRHTSRMPSSA